MLNLGLGGARLKLGPATALNDGQSLLLGIILADGTLLETIEAEVLEVPKQSEDGTSVRVLFHPMDPHIQLQLGRLIHEFKISGGENESDPESAREDPSGWGAAADDLLVPCAQSGPTGS